MVTKDILNQYVDLQKEIVEVRQRIRKTEEQIEKIEAEGVVVDKVTGGEGGIQSFRIEGFPYPEYSKKKTLLFARKTTLSALEMEIESTLNQVEDFITNLDDSRMRRIIRLRFVENKSWMQVANAIGGGNTEDGVRMMFNRFMEKN